MKKATAKATDKITVTASTRVGGEATAREAKATQENDETEKIPKKKANPSGKATLATTVTLRDTLVETIQRGMQMKPRETPQQTRHCNLPSKMTSIFSSKTRYTCAPMTETLMTKFRPRKMYVYRPTYHMSQQTNNSDKVSTAQTTENRDQTEAKTTIAGDQSTLTFGG
jgi:hypothetical protein